MLMVVTLTGCSVPRGQNGKTYVNSIYTNNDVQVKRGDVDIPDDKELQKKYKDYKADDLITIEKQHSRMQWMRDGSMGYRDGRLHS